MSVREEIAKALELLKNAETEPFMIDPNFGITHTSRTAHEQAAKLLSEARQEVNKHASTMDADTFWRLFNKISAAYDAVTQQMCWGSSEVEYTIRNLESIQSK